MILDVVCDDPALHNILIIVKRTLSLIQIIGPVICLVSLVMTIIFLVNNPEDKKAMAKIKNTLIALLLLFGIPVIVDSVMVLADDSFIVSSCWKDVDDQIDDSDYIEDDREKSSVVIDPSEYKPGESDDE